mgnify:CR=1 FL=1
MAIMLPCSGSPQKGSSMHLSLFHKTIENYITFNNFSAPASGFFSEEDYPQSALVSSDESVFLMGRYRVERISTPMKIQKLQASNWGDAPILTTYRVG